MNIWLKNLVCGFVTVLVLGTVFFPSPSFAQTGDGQSTTDDLTDYIDSQVGTAPQTNQQLITNTGSNYQDAQSGLPECGILPGSDGTVEGCFVRIIYYVTLYPSAWIASIAGQIFDYFIAYSLGSEAYQAGGFVTKGWTVVRDIANASFIFILLYLAITLVVNGKQANTKLLSKVVMVAIVINFSLFMTRVIIDAGNILGRVFYEKTIVENDDIATSTGYTTLSAGLIKHVSPQRLLSSDMFKKKYEPANTQEGSFDNSLGDLSDEGSYEHEISTGFLILVLLIATAVNLAIAWIFFSVSIFFLGRTLGLWIMMIMSPVAFATISIPFAASKLPKFAFNSWLSKTASLSFMPVVFMFFLYLTIMFIDVAFTSVFSVFNNTDSASTAQNIMSVIVPAAAIIFLLKLAKDQAKDMSGEFGGMVGTALKKAVGFSLGAAGLGLGAAAGVGAVAGRQVLGRWGSNLAGSADTSTAMGRFQKRAGESMAKNNYDARSIKIPKPIGTVTNWGKTGLSYATDGYVGTGDMKFSNLSTLGGPKSAGYSQLREEYAKEKIEKAKMYKVDEDSVVNDIQGTYAYEEIDPATGKVVKKTGVVSGNTSVNGARSEKANAQRILDATKAEIHQKEDYDTKKRELEERERNAEKAEKAYKEILDKKKAGDPSVKQKDVDIAEMERNSKKNLVDAQKKEIKKIENMYIEENNKIAEAEARIAAAERALAKRNADILNKYADSVENWAAFPDAGLTHRYGANQDASGGIRNLANKEEKKGK